MKGTIEELDQFGGQSKIRGADGHIYRFHFGVCVEKSDTFNALEIGTNVVFNKCIGGKITQKTESENTSMDDFVRVADWNAFGLVAVNVAIDTSDVVRAEDITKQTQDVLAWIMRGGSEAADENAKMVEKLERLDMGLEAAANFYKEQYGQDLSEIKGILEGILSYGMTEGLNPDTIDLQALFAGLQGVELSSQDIAFFRSLQSQFMEKSPETQAHMFWFFELVHDYVVSKSNDITIRTNPIKNILFSDKDASYKQWISGIFEGFKKNESGMISLSKSIRAAEAPQIGLKQFIRHLFDTKPEVLDEEDHTWLQALYTQWPDEEVTNKPDTISNADKNERNRIAKKYVFDHSEMGKASFDAEQNARVFRRYKIGK